MLRPSARSGVTVLVRAARATLAALVALAAAACGDGASASGASDPQDPPPSPRPAAAWSAPALLFDADGRIAAGAALHAVGRSDGAISHRVSTDDGATWSAPRAIPGAGLGLPLYGPLAAQGATVHLLTRDDGTLRMQRSLDGGATWSTPVPLAGYAADGSERVQVATDGDAVHVYLGRAGATPDATFRNYYWRSTDAGATWSAVRVLDDPAGPASPGGIAAEGGVVHLAYAAILPGAGSLGHRARHRRSTDGGATWSAPTDVGGGSANPQIRPRPRVADGHVIVLWEEPLDHDASRPAPNATRAQIRASRSADGGRTWTAPFDVTAVTGAYPNHPEIAVGPAARVHVAYRLSRDQASLSAADVVGYRASLDHGATWGDAETAVDVPGAETHPFNLVATARGVHLLVGGDRFRHARRALP